jgi:hypothetical protein
MKRFKTINLRAAILLILFALCSCIFNSDKHLIGRYYLKHGESGKSICYRVDDSGGCVEIINGAFGPIGYDNNYIIVEESQYEYLIIIVYKKMNCFPEKGILGPYNSNEFNRQKLKFHIKANFTIDTN